MKNKILKLIGIIIIVSVSVYALFTLEEAVRLSKDSSAKPLIILEENYRSTKNILNAANSVIKNNKQRKEKNLWTDNIEGDKIKYYRAMDEKDEAFYVVKEIKKLIDQGTKNDDIAILYRTNAQSRNIEDALLRETITYKVVGRYYICGWGHIPCVLV